MCKENWRPSLLAKVSSLAGTSEAKDGDTKMSDAVAPAAAEVAGTPASKESDTAVADAVVLASEEIAVAPGSLVVKEEEAPAATHSSVDDDGGTLVSAESLTAAYKALGHAALSVVHGNYSNDPML